MFRGPYRPLNTHRSSAVAEAVDAAPVLLRRTTGASIAAEQRGRDVLAGRRRGAEIDDALGRDRGSNPAIDELQDLEDSVAITVAHLDTIADAHRPGGLGGGAVDLDVPALARRGGQRAGLVDAYRPQPLIDPCRVDDPFCPAGEGGMVPNLG